MRGIRLLSGLSGIGAMVLSFSSTVRAHCPLCSAGAVGAAAIASALGIGLDIVGVFIGAFAAATGYWTESRFSHKYMPYQNWGIPLLTYLLIVIPILPMMTEQIPVFLSIAGEYGSLFNRTYLINTYLIGAMVGGILTSVTPRISQLISKFRGSNVPFQGMALTFVLLGIASIFLHFTI